MVEDHGNWKKTHVKSPFQKINLGNKWVNLTSDSGKNMEHVLLKQTGKRSGFANRILCLINLNQFYDKMMTGFVGMGRASHPIHFDFSLLSTSSLTIFLYPNYNVIVWMGGQ